jgi:hypothetical protein
MRWSYSGRRFNCLSGVLLALLLTAPISMQAQAGSSPQPRASAPAPATQSTPACSNAPPISQRGEEARLPPCPDTPQASPDSTYGRPPNPNASLIDRARDAAFEFADKLPNYICDEVMSRFSQRGQEKMPLDTVSAEILYQNGQETYRNVKINDRSTDQGLDEIAGSSSTGEFASTLLALFHPDTDATFRSGGLSSISGVSAQVYDFQVRNETSHWVLHAGSQTVNAAYSGSVWIDPKTARVLRIEMQARNLPSGFPMDWVESSVEYSYVTIDGMSFLLPTRAESLGCERGSKVCRHNVIYFRNYHEFKVEIKIGGN